MGLEQSSLIWPAWRMSRAAKMIACWTLPRSRPACTCPASQHLTQPESGITRALYDCPDQRLGKTGKRVRLIVATHPAGATRSRVGLTRAGVIYELFLTALPQSAFTAADVVSLYLHRGAFETTLADEDTEQDPDRWCSHAACGKAGMACHQPMGVEPASGVGPSASS